MPQLKIGEDGVKVHIATLSKKTKVNDGIFDTIKKKWERMVEEGFEPKFLVFGYETFEEFYYALQGIKSQVIPDKFMDMDIVILPNTAWGVTVLPKADHAFCNKDKWSRY